MEGVDSDGRFGLLGQREIDALEFPDWEVRGVGLRWVDEPGTGYNPKTGEIVPTKRRRIRRDFEMPIGADFDAYILAQLGERRSRPMDGGTREATPDDIATS